MPAVEEGWQRRIPLVELDSHALSRLVGAPVLDSQVLAGGLRNTNYRLRLPDANVVLRFYTGEAAACTREIAVIRLVGERVPVPRVLDARPDADPPWVLFEFIEGVRFDHLPPHDIEAAAYDAGRVLAGIHAFAFPGGVVPDPHLDLFRYSGGGYGFVEYIEHCVVGRPAAQRLGPERTERLLRVVRDNASRLAVQDACLQHSDYKPWNLLVRAGRIAAVLDWEFAFAGPRLNDVGNFLRHSERQPAVYLDGFVRGYLAGGGVLPDDWFRLARLQELMGLCEFLNVPDDTAIVRDIQPLIERTIDLFST